MVLIVNLNRHPGFSFPLSFCFLVVCVLSCASLCESTRSHCSLDLSAAWVIPDQICFTSLLFCTHSDPAHGMQLNASYLSSLWLSHSVFVCFLYLFFFFTCSYPLQTEQLQQTISEPFVGLHHRARAPVWTAVQGLHSNPLSAFQDG